jgi:hypothetical protein
MLEVKKTLRINDQLISFGNYIPRGEQAGSLVYENLDNGQIVYFTKEILKTIKNQEKGICLSKI